jgi:hypothetical protein
VAALVLLYAAIGSAIDGWLSSVKAISANPRVWMAASASHIESEFEHRLEYE